MNIKAKRSKLSKLQQLKRRRWNILGLLLSGLFLMTGLYQIEIMWIQKAWEWPGFMMPFGWIVPWWFARDIWYAFIIIGWLLAIIALWFWED